MTAKRAAYANIAGSAFMSATNAPGLAASP